MTKYDYNLAKKNAILLVAGGTGGHVFPAVALSHELKKRGYPVCLAIDHRAQCFVEDFPPEEIYVVPSFQIRLSNPVVIFRSLMVLWKGFIVSLRLIRKLKPKVIVGFGGYHTLSPMLAGIILQIPSMIHEQNAVMGRANRLLSWGVKVIAGGLLSSKKGFLSHKIIITGNPVRNAFIKMANIPYQASYSNQPFRLLIFGGSQGAKVFSDIIPKSIALIPKEQRQRLIITQQVKEDEKEIVQKIYDNLGLKAHISSFFKDIEKYIFEANLLICRSGALTVSEIAVIGRPVILIPYPHSINQDQLHNAWFLQEGGGAKVIIQNFLSPERLANEISSAMKNPESLVQMAKQVSMKGKYQAVLSLSDLVEQLARKESVSSLGRKYTC
ncbi:UDP-N-acetylglucosamine--N-acetylmuramyl-(pentapeptide) pyrophosphoryl-undecaprenol N-acetylglucosamine transferase [Candidatus Liberibacter solanacearum]|uniref:undecaprenyldiphospho-muramoylpentapeptide beta-N-acetylglucosaminyltransferase n=1 Tax=Candidatus Liberibacter solanacearum TaxID=556287 RepID=UPI003871E2E2